MTKRRSKTAGRLNARETVCPLVQSTLKTRSLSAEASFGKARNAAVATAADALRIWLCMSIPLWRE
jgi:hypothetical protein